MPTPRQRLADGPPELRQAYMKVIFNRVVVDREEIRLEGAKAVLEQRTETGASDSLPEVLSFAQGWRAEWLKARTGKLQSNSAAP